MRCSSPACISRGSRADDDALYSSTLAAPSHQLHAQRRVTLILDYGALVCDAKKKPLGPCLTLYRLYPLPAPAPRGAGKQTHLCLNSASICTADGAPLATRAWRVIARVAAKRTSGIRGGQRRWRRRELSPAARIAYGFWQRVRAARGAGRVPGGRLPHNIFFCNTVHTMHPAAQPEACAAYHLPLTTSSRSRRCCHRNAAGRTPRRARVRCAARRAVL